MLGMHFSAGSLDPEIIRPFSEAYGFRKRLGAQRSYFYFLAIVTVRRFRPLARRRLSTRRPWAVFIRLRNP